MKTRLRQICKHEQSCSIFFKLSVVLIVIIIIKNEQSIINSNTNFIKNIIYLFCTLVIMCMSVIELSSVTYTINYTAKMLMHERSCMSIYQHNYCYWCLLHVYSRKHKVLGQTEGLEIEYPKESAFPLSKRLQKQKCDIRFKYNNVYV